MSLHHFCFQKYLPSCNDPFRVVLPQRWRHLITGHCDSSWTRLCWCPNSIWLDRLSPMFTFCHWIWKCRCVYLQNTHRYKVKRNFYLLFTARQPRKCSLIHPTNSLQGAYQCHSWPSPQPATASSTNSTCPESGRHHLERSRLHSHLSEYPTIILSYQYNIYNIYITIISILYIYIISI